MILTRTQWQLRRAVTALTLFFTGGGYERHADKTLTGRISRGFDRMGIMFNYAGATEVAPRALSHHRQPCRRLYAWGICQDRVMAGRMQAVCVTCGNLEKLYD
ncbi:hypothetical protein BL250_07315 [Erwinia sp. OLTSP20]|nr:hypothetical protein BV501_08120 [Erwinia sp. OAMSP11]PIJ72903.1 hypothetical protein BK416_08395 [Erwinia sp. OLSSP12]PIJ82233.1 hypothetical protein BLD47_06855 [Erwinia sp. OLCASP19]PIJ84786.1 hypothetical protein BLD46_07250 [Erwinia sp. OLMTSP26]PIJ86751.1 hypothetical protein BLD49_07975 [Erwinia sp. OLMDSP33]PIJ89890.1 hypothetical protein BL249_14815 [Erwinia sp. OLFS4]PIJ93179.1 hypothetical protein BL250_07315 [Erwinia sp. OLTSP20]